MIWVGILLFAFGAVRLVVGFVNWLSRPSLSAYRHSQVPARVSVLIPARNEEHNIGNLLADLLKMSDDIHQIIVYDDLSTDHTADIVAQFALKNKKIELLHSKPMPQGWLGKNHACHCLSLAATGEWLLFLDADVRVEAETISRAVRYSMDKRLDLLSIFPEQLMPNVGTRMAVPLMNWILLSLLPLVMVRVSPFVSMSAANGQFMFFGAESYRRQQPHSRFRMSAVEDMAIVRDYKRKGLKVDALLANNDVKCTMYGDLRQAVDGFSKNIFHFFGGSYLVCCVFAVVTTVAPMFVFLVNGATMGCLYLAMILLTRYFISKASRQSWLWNILLIIPQQMVLWRIIIEALTRKAHKNLQWKGRNIYSEL